MSWSGLSRRQLLTLAGVAGGAAALPRPASAAVADPVADLYHRLLLLHTRWSESQWDESAGAYQAADFRFAVVLGHAVLLTSDGYDADLAGVDQATLKTRTLATIQTYAATNRLTGGTDWGRRLFWDSEYELYLVLAARLLWADLDARTRSDVDAIATGQAAYTYGLGLDDDPLSKSEKPGGLVKMGGYAQAMAPGLAWAEEPGWRDRFHLWMSNAPGLPVADRVNPAIQPRNTAGNIQDTFMVAAENGFDPFDQAELWRSAGRVAACFLLAGQPLPPILTTQPNARELWDTLKLLASDAGEPVMPMIADHYHAYGRDVLPLAFLAQVQGDQYAARAEADLAARLLPFLNYRPAYRLTKPAGEDRYEPAARAELAIAYLLHRSRAVPTRPVSTAAFFAAASGTRDFGSMTVQQSGAAFAAAVTQDKYVNLLWQPRHDNWLVDTSAIGFLPPGTHDPTATWSRAYQQIRDGVDATATVLTFGKDYAGFTTLPTGSVVYASTGVGTDEGGLSVFNLDMPGVSGLTGERTYTGAWGPVTFSGANGGGGDGGADELHFAPRMARYVRMLGIAPANRFGYSIWTFSVLDLGGGDLAQGALATGSSEDVWHAAYNATDGNPDTRWAVHASQQRRADSWFAVDLGSLVTITGVRIQWESAYGNRYLIQTSYDGVTWDDVVSVPDARMLTGRWVDIDGRAGLVVRGSVRPITVTATGVIAATGPAAPTTVEGYVTDRDGLIAAAGRPTPVAPEPLRVSDADGYLSVFNLGKERVVAATVVLPSAARLYLGSQVVTDEGLEWGVSLDGATAAVEPPRFMISGVAPAGTRYVVTDSHHLSVIAPPEQDVAVTARAGTWWAAVRVAAGRSRPFVVPGDEPVTPTADLARGRTAFPASPLPAGMNAPGYAVDGDPGTSWRPGPSGRMVVDLGEVADVTLVRLSWTRGALHPVRVSGSVDGLDFRLVATVPRPGRSAASVVKASARYIAVTVIGWHPGDAELIELAVE